MSFGRKPADNTSWRSTGPRPRQASRCYARGDKNWVVDPQGIPWETYRIFGECPIHGDDTVSRQFDVARQQRVIDQMCVAVAPPGVLSISGRGARCRRLDQTTVDPHRRRRQVEPDPAAARADETQIVAGAM